jgi:hypothetical protein
MARAASNDNCRSMITAWALAACGSDDNRHAPAAHWARRLSDSGI